MAWGLIEASPVVSVNAPAALHCTNHSTTTVWSQRGRDAHTPAILGVPRQECPRQDSNLRRPGLGALPAASPGALYA